MTEKQGLALLFLFFWHDVFVGIKESLAEGQKLQKLEVSGFIKPHHINGISAIGSLFITAQVKVMDWVLIENWLSGSGMDLIEVDSLCLGVGQQSVK